MVNVDYILGTSFTWIQQKDGNISVHLCQSAFTEFTAHWFSVQIAKKFPNMTQYRFGFPIDSIPPVDPLDPDINRWRHVYQIIVGCVNWLATCTRPDIPLVLTFLTSYRNYPHPQHYKAAVHVLKYLTSTNEYGISFHSDSLATIQAFNHFPRHQNREAYTEATAPSPSECHQLTAYCDANWGGKFVSAFEDGTQLELFKFRSLSGFLICLCSGPISWKSILQNKTALISCEAEIVATNKCTTELQSIKHRPHDIGIPEVYSCTIIYNDNKAAVKWVASVTSKVIKHLNLEENIVREWHQSKDVDVEHIPGIINPSNIFTKEMKDNTHLRNLRDSRMVSSSFPDAQS